MDRRDLIESILSNLVNYCSAGTNKATLLCYTTKSVEL